MSLERKPGGSVIAAFDIGSNTIKMTIGQCIGGVGIHEIASASETVRLSADIEQSGRLRADRIDDALAAIARFADQARAAGAERLIGVGTEAIRVAENGGAFLEQVQQETGVLCHVITGDEEAVLTFRGLANELDMSGSLVVADVGGGSTELITSVDGILGEASSLPIGSGRLTDRFVREDPPTITEIAACRRAARGIVAESWPGRIAPSRLAAVGGTGEFLMRLVPHDPPAYPDDVETVLTRLSTIPARELAELIDIPTARARVLPAGVAIVAAIVDVTGPEVVTAARSGIRMGLLLDACAQ